MVTATAPDTSAQLQARARRLRSQAASLHPLLARAYRRRAAELDVQALLEAVWNPPVDLGGTPATGGTEGTAACAAGLHLAIA